MHGIKYWVKACWYSSMEKNGSLKLHFAAFGGVNESIVKYVSCRLFLQTFLYCGCETTLRSSLAGVSRISEI